MLLHYAVLSSLMYTLKSYLLIDIEETTPYIGIIISLST